MIHAQIRPGRFRPVLTMVLITIVLVVCWLGLEVFFALTSKPNPTVDYGKVAEEYVRAAQADLPGEDVWPVLIETTQLFNDSLVDLVDPETDIAWGKGSYSFDALYSYDEMLADLRGDEADTSSIETEQYDALEAHRRMSERAIARWDELGITRRLDEVAASGKAVRPMPDTTQTMMIDILLPELSTFRNMARGLRARMSLARDAGDWELYVKSFEHGLAIGRIGMAQTTLIDRLVGIAIRALMFGQLRDDLVAGALPDEACVQVLGALDRQRHTTPAAHGLDGELFMQLDAVQWTHDRRGRVILSQVQRLHYMPGSGLAITNVASIVFPRREQTERWFRDFNEQLKEYVSRPVAERCAEARSGQVAEPQYTSSWNTLVQDALIPAYGSALRADDLSEMQELSLRVMIAIERYRHARGELPQSLAALTPDWLPEPAVDPYSIDGNLFGYRVFDEPDEDGRQYVLYSIGFDGVDNGGAAPTERQTDALRMGYTGTDYVLTDPN